MSLMLVKKKKFIKNERNHDKMCGLQKRVHKVCLNFFFQGYKISCLKHNEHYTITLDLFILAMTNFQNDFQNIL